jgi:hypothetical protein
MERIYIKNGLMFLLTHGKHLMMIRLVYSTLKKILKRKHLEVVVNLKRELQLQMS